MGDSQVENFVASPTSPEALAAKELSSALAAAEAELATPRVDEQDEFPVETEEIKEYDLEEFEEPSPSPTKPDPAPPEFNTTDIPPKPPPGLTPPVVPLVPLMAAGVSGGLPSTIGPGGPLTARSSIPSTQRSRISKSKTRACEEEI